MSKDHDERLAALYPDVVAAGGLGAFFLEALGTDVMQDAPAPGDTTGARWSATVYRHGARLPEEPDMVGAHWRISMDVGLAERAFHLSLIPDSSGIAFASGWVPQVDAVCRIVHLCLGSSDVGDVVDHEPLIEWTVDGQAFVSGDEAEWRWQHMLTDGFPDERGRALNPLVQAAAREPNLRRLRPYTSMWNLCFSRRPRYPFTEHMPSINARPASDSTTGFVYTVHAGPAGSTATVSTDSPAIAAAHAARLAAPGDA